MATALADYIKTAPLVDSHEHLRGEAEWVEAPGDVLVDLFGNYVPADFLAAGADPRAVAELTNPCNPDLPGRFSAVADVWQQIRFTGYGEAVRLVAQTFYDLDEITAAGVLAAAPRAAALRRPGERRRILEEMGGLDHVQIDDFCWPCPPDPAGRDFFFRDLNWQSFSSGTFQVAEVGAASGVDVQDLPTLRAAIEALFARHAPTAIAVKTQHAYGRTLRWQERADADAARVLALKLGGADLTAAERDLLGDWCLARGVEQSVGHRLPVKVHTGYYAGNDRMNCDFIRPGHLAPLLARYPEARFVLMHASYPYTAELIALAKHYRNVWADCCWAWSMNPRQVMRFVREYLHAAPVNKLLIFGGDTPWPTGAVGYALQCRRWLTRALEAEVAEGDLTEPAALAIAERVMHRNQWELFDLPAKRAASLAG